VGPLGLFSPPPSIRLAIISEMPVTRRAARGAAHRESFPETHPETWGGDHEMIPSPGGPAQVSGASQSHSADSRSPGLGPISRNWPHLAAYRPCPRTTKHFPSPAHGNYWRKVIIQTTAQRTKAPWPTHSTCRPRGFFICPPMHFSGKYFPPPLHPAQPPPSAK
jgi:hypothetical protein